MKSFKLISAALAIAAVMFTGCQEDELHGLDTSKPAPENVAYNEANSTNVIVAVTWDATKAIEAGATSFTVQANTTSEGGGDNYDDKISQVVMVEDSEIYTEGAFDSKLSYCNAIALKKLPQASVYYIRVRANYRNSVVSEWVYLEDSNGPLANSVALSTPEINMETVKITPTTIYLEWSKVDAAAGYQLEFRKAGASTWNTIDLGKETKFTLEELDSETPYEVRITAIKGNYKSHASETLSAKTLETAIFNFKEIDKLIEFLNGDVPAQKGESLVINLDEDMSLAGKTWPTITEYMGEFNGNGHSIKDWNTNKPLFAKLTGTVKDLVIDASCTVKIEGPQFAVVTTMNEGTIEKVTNKATLTYSVDDTDESAPVLIAAIASTSKGTIKDCINEGAITVTSAKGFHAAGVSGIAALQSGTTSGCVNKGDVTMTSLYTNSKNVSVGEGIGKAVPCIGGIIAYCGDGSTTSGCTNEGKVTFTQTEINNTPAPANLNRHMLGGIVGASNGNITDSHNKGAITITAISTDGKLYKGLEYTFCIGGISGGEYYATNSQNVTNITNCTNTAAIVVDCDAQKSNSTLGGIVGWPNNESAPKGSVVVTEGCSNTGDITLSGTGKFRAGGIQGGSGAIVNSKNTGNITINGADAASVAGLVAGFHSGGFAFTDNVAEGTLKVCKIAGAGALIGNIGNAAHDTGTGCKANAVLDAASATSFGMVIGTFNGTSAKINIGTEASPVKIKGTVNGTVLDATNYTNYVAGTKNYTPGTHNIVAVYGE